MEYLKPKFTLPAGPKNVSQEEWDRIFGVQPTIGERTGEAPPSRETSFGQPPEHIPFRRIRAEASLS